MHGAEHDQPPGGSEEPRRPGHGLERRALVIGVAAIALPAPDRQHEFEARRIGHPRQPQAIGPAAAPAFGDLGDGAAGGAVGAEEPEFEAIMAAERQPARHGCGNFRPSAHGLDPGSAPGGEGLSRATALRRRRTPSMPAKAQRPWKSGRRRSAIALIPSRKSSVRRSQSCSTSSRSVAASMASIRPRRSVSRVETTAGGGDFADSERDFWAAARNSPRRNKNLAKT